MNNNNNGSDATGNSSDKIEIVALQTGQMREAYENGKLDEEYNNKPVEIDNYKLIRKFLTHREEAEREAKDWNTVWSNLNNIGLKILEDGVLKSKMSIQDKNLNNSLNEAIEEEYE